jgi:hypothetical protein
MVPHLADRLAALHERGHRRVQGQALRQGLERTSPPPAALLDRWHAPQEQVVVVGLEDRVQVLVAPAPVRKVARGAPAHRAPTITTS